MSRAKQASKRKHRACAVPLLGAAGLSLSLASGASAATDVPAANMPTLNTTANEMTLAEEEIADVESGDVLCLRQGECRNIRTRRTTCWSTRDTGGAATEAAEAAEAAEAVVEAAALGWWGGCGCGGCGCGGCFGIGFRSGLLNSPPTGPRSPSSAFGASFASATDTPEKTIPRARTHPEPMMGKCFHPPSTKRVIQPPPIGDEKIYTDAPNPDAGHKE